MFEWTNAPGNSTSIGLLFDSLFESLPLAWRVQLQGGKWELFDANALARKHASGKAARVRLPPRMALRARGVTMKWLTPNSRMVSGALRVPAAGAKSVGEALRLSGVTAMKWIPSEAHSAMKWPARLGGNGFGFVLSVGPSLVNDAIGAGLFHDASSSANWKDFAIRSADSQSGNLAGYAAGVTAGIALGFAAGAGIAVAAPVAIVIGLAAGIGGQTLFNAFGFNERAKELMTDLVR